PRRGGGGSGRCPGRRHPARSGRRRPGGAGSARRARRLRPDHRDAPACGRPSGHRGNRGPPGPPDPAPPGGDGGDRRSGHDGSRAVTERGGATIVAVALISGLVVVAAGLAAVGRVVAAYTQATAAADAAALAAAPLTFLPGDPVFEAAAYARANGAELVRCGCEKAPGDRKSVV